MPSTALMIAIGSPLTNALGIAGSVGSHRRVPVAGGRVGPRRAVPSPPAGFDATPRRGRWLARPPAPTTCGPRRAWPGRPRARRSACPVRPAGPEGLLRRVSAETAASWLACASMTAWSAFCLASRAADSLLTCSVRARCRSAITCWALAASVCAGGGGVEDVGGVGGGQVGTRRAVDIGRAAKVSKRCCADDRGVGVLDAPLAGIHLQLGGRGVVAAVCTSTMALLTLFLLGLDGGAEVLQLLIGVGDGGDQRAAESGLGSARDPAPPATAPWPSSIPTVSGTAQTGRTAGKRRREGCVSFDQVSYGSTRTCRHIRRRFCAQKSHEEQLQQ